MSDTLATQRLILRPPHAEDAETIARLAGDPAVSRMVTQIPQPYPVEAAEGWIWLMDVQRDLGRHYPFAITLRDGPLIGMVGAHRTDTPRTFEVGYWVGAPYWNHGYATEAVRALVHWLQEELGARTLTAGHFADNTRSLRVLEKAGFRYTGTERSLYSMARDARVRALDMKWTAPEPAFAVA